MIDVKDAVTKARLLLPTQHVFLISHMRANTSVVSHLIGSHDDISGYYEMHIGYYSWKSLINQKFIFHEQNVSEPLTPIYFDKLLHNDHGVNPALLGHQNVKCLFSIREPIATINSIVKLYRSKHPEHPFTEQHNAAVYYCERIQGIIDFAMAFEGDNAYLYYDAEALISDTETVLGEIQRYIGLDSPFETTYKQFAQTGKKTAGDSSENILSGKVLQKKGDSTALDIDEELLLQCQDAYVRCRTLLKSRSWVSEGVEPATTVS
ncbi:hypothetical protein L4C36_03235 [Photobacterium japonica]|uniref:hypothetical protein n=1 Tax=Photobacterium japonica TaxID=2910235 RepID=UPI003D13F36B